jgi:hypothetical protein
MSDLPNRQLLKKWSQNLFMLSILNLTRQVW